MKCALALCVLALAVAAVSGSADDWVEPSYADANAEADATEEASFLEDGTRTGVRSKGRLRGISHTVSGHHGMVTYISPARHVQTSGIVLTPPPTVSVVTAAPPVYVQPVVVPHADYHYAVGHDDHDHGHDHGHSHSHSHHHLPALADYEDDHMIVHSHNHGPHRRVALDHEHIDSRVIAHDADGLHSTHGHHHHHAHAHAHYIPSRHHHSVNGQVHVARGDVHAHSPLAVPASLWNGPYHQPHYGHDSSVSQGAILVPHGPEGAIALEEPEYTGYNPGPVYQYNSIPTAYYSDGTAHRASINQRFN